MVKVETLRHGFPTSLSTSKMVRNKNRQFGGDVIEDVPSDDSSDDEQEKKKPRIRQRPNDRVKGRVMKPVLSNSISIQGFNNSRMVGGSQRAIGSSPSHQRSPSTRQENGIQSTMDFGSPRSSRVTIRKRKQRVERTESVTSKSSGTVDANCKEDNIFLTVWKPSWATLLQLERGILPVKSKEFVNEILEVFRPSIPQVTRYKDGIAVMRVKGIGDDISLESCAFRDSPQFVIASKETKTLQSSDPKLQSLLPKLISIDDIVLLQLGINSPVSRDSSKLSLIIHITPKSYSSRKIVAPGERLGSVSYDLAILTEENQGCTILKFQPVNFEWPELGDNDNNLLPNRQLSLTVRDDEVPGPSNRAFFNQSHSFPDPVLESIVEVEDHDMIDMANDLELINPNQPKTDFGVDQLVRDGIQFIPGPMRPKLKKDDSRSNYSYHKLNELTLMLEKSMKDEAKNSGSVTSMIKRPCYTYGQVVEVISVHRYEASRAHIIRICDETIPTDSSILVRLIAAAGDKVGPIISVGDVIRLHRMTVQLEYDEGEGETRMVLSTGQHWNYVLFKVSPTDSSKFIYETCAKSITLGEYDEKRVTDISRLERTRLNQRQPVRVEPRPTSGCTSSQQNLNNVVSPISRPSAQPPSPFIASIPGEDGIANVVLEPGAPSSCSDASSTITDGISSKDIRSSKKNSSSSPSSIDSFASALSDDVQIIMDNRKSKRKRNDTPKENKADDQNSTGVAAVPSPPPLPLRQATSVSSGQLAQNCELLLAVGTRLTQPEFGTKYTCFTNLSKTSSSATLLCQIDELASSSKKNMWYLIIKDGEHSKPSADFANKNHPLLDGENANSHLVLDVKNGERFSDRGLVRHLSESLGSDDLFIIEDVKIRGDKTPCQLEVDGEKCVIRLATFEDLADGLGSSGFTRSTLSNSQPHHITVSSDGTSYQTVPEFEEDDGASGHAESQLSISDEVHNTRSKSNKRKQVDSDGNSENASSPTKAPWDGRPKHRRRRRQHYQDEDSFDC